MVSVATGPGLQALDADLFAGLEAVAVAAVLDALQGLVDLADKLALAITGAQLQAEFLFLGRPVVGIGKVGGLILHVRNGAVDLFHEVALPALQDLAEVLELLLAHVRFAALRHVRLDVARASEQAARTQPRRSPRPPPRAQAASTRAAGGAGVDAGARGFCGRSRGSALRRCRSVSWRGWHRTAGLDFFGGGARRSATTVFAFSTGLLAASLRTAARLTGFFTLVGFGAVFLAGIGHSWKSMGPFKDAGLYRPSPLQYRVPANRFCGVRR